MRKILVQDANPGDVIGQPVVNEKGMTLLPKGATLTIALVNRLRGWGIQEVEIEGEDPHAPPPKALPELLEELDHRFRGREGNPLMVQIKAIIREQIIAKGGE